MGMPSPYYTQSHRKWQKICREFISEHLEPYALDWETQGEVPDHMFKTFTRYNILVPNLPALLPTQLLKSVGITELLGGLKIEEFDYFLTTSISLFTLARCEGWVLEVLPLPCRPAWLTECHLSLLTEVENCVLHCQWRKEVVRYVGYARNM